MMIRHRPTNRSLGLAALLVVTIGGLLLACTVAPPQTPITNSTPAWACPSPTPLPYGEAGPVKEWIEGEAKPTRVPSGPVEYEDDTPVYYEEWEQEYGAVASGPPFPSPTPYIIEGNVFTFGQRVRMEPVFAQVEASPGAVAEDGRQLYLIDITWNNPTVSALAISYSTQVLLRAVTLPDGGEATSDSWRVSMDAMTLAGIDELPSEIPVGESRVTIPVLGPKGEPASVEIVMRRDGAYVPIYAPTGTVTAPPTATPVASPTPNVELRRTDPDEVAVTFVAARPIDPPCEHPGAMTAWDSEGVLVNGVADVPVAAPPGSGRLVELALAQVGKPYVWGATGPHAFDCSGLVVWSYAQIGMRIPARTAEGQFRAMKPVAASAALPGDTMYFNASGNPNAKITHAAIYVGDINNDSVGDVVHAASPKYGVVMIQGGLRSNYYFGSTCELCFTGYRTMR